MAGGLRLPGHLADHPRAYSVSRDPAWDRIPGQIPQNGEDCGIIPVNHLRPFLGRFDVYCSFATGTPNCAKVSLYVTDALHLIGEDQ
jgi:hypothetical protein